jgi:DNA-binding transcriptional ArsR family regulator
MLKELLVSDVRIKILKLLILNPDKSYHVRAIVRAVGAEINAVRRELENLTNINLLRRRQSSNRIYFSVDTNHVYYSDLLSLMGKEEGLGGAILKHVRDLGDVQFAVLAKTFLKNKPTSQLDVDLFLVGNIKLDVLEKYISAFQTQTGREVNYSTMTAEEFRHRKRSNDQFVMSFLSKGRSMLIGDEEKFSSML